MFVRTKIPMTLSNNSGAKRSYINVPKHVEVRILDADDSGNAIVGLGNISFSMDMEDLDVWPEEISEMTH